VEGLIVKGNLDEEVTAIDSMDMMDSTELSVRLFLALNRVEDNEDWRSALSVQKSLR